MSCVINTILRNRGTAGRILAAALLCLSIVTWCDASEESLEVRTVQAVIGNLLLKPEKNSLVLDTLKKGDRVTLFVKEGEWYVAKLPDGRVGWLHQSLFMTPAEAGIPATAEEPVAEAVPRPVSSEPLTPTPLTEKTPPPLYQAALKVEAGRVREAPDFKAPIRFLIEKGEVVSVMETEGKWYLIRLSDGRTGWSHQQLFSRDLPRKIEQIRVESGPDGTEKVIFVLNGFYPPKTFAIDEEEIPKVVCDFFDTGFAEGVGQTVPVRGDLLQAIRIGLHEAPRPKARVVIDLNPHRRYNVDQVFFKKSNTYTLSFRPMPESPSGRP